MVFGLVKGFGKQFQLFRRAAVNPGDVDVHVIPDFKHIFGINNVA